MSVQSIERAFAILEAVAAHPDGAGVTAVAKRTDLHKSTVSRLLATLEGVNAVERRPNGDGFQIGTAILSLVSQLPFPQNLIKLARPHLLRLAETTGETVGLSVPDGDEVHYIDQVNCDHHIRVRDWTGDRFPMHVVSAGKVYLAYRSEAALERYLAAPLVAYASRTLTDPAALRQQLQQVRAQGFEWSIDEFEDGLAAVSAPIMSDGRPVAAVYICGPSYRFPAEGEAERMTQLVVEASGRISEQLSERS